MRQNKYVMKARQEHLLKKVDALCRYSPPDESRKEEHKLINDAINEAMRVVVSVCPDPLQSPNVEDVIAMLFHAKNAANGLLAVHGSRSESETHIEMQYATDSEGPWSQIPSFDRDNPSVFAKVRFDGREWSPVFRCPPMYASEEETDDADSSSD